MGLASKLAAASAAPGGGGHSYGAPPPAAGQQYSAQPQGYPPQQASQQGYPPAQAQQGYPPAQAQQQQYGIPQNGPAGSYPPQQGGILPQQQAGHSPYPQHPTSFAYGANAANPSAPLAPQQGYPGAAPPQQQGYPGGPPGQQQGYPGANPAQQQGYPGAPPHQQGYPGAPPPQQQGYPGAAPGQQQGYPGAPPGQQQGYPGAPQPQQQGYPGGPAGMGGASGGGLSAPSILARLQKIVQVNGLQRFYPPQQLEAVAQRVARVDFHGLAARWRMPVELALDFAALALYDIVLYADDSGSMAFEDNGERIEDLKLILGRVAEVATLFDDDGILVRFMNSPVEGNGIRSAADASALLSKVTFGGTTPLAASMATRVINPVVLSMAQRGQLAKPVLVISITDGEPTDTPKDAILSLIRDVKGRLAQAYGPKAVAFQFAQVGRDSRAQAFLGKLDKDPGAGDVIDCTSYFEQEAEEYARKGVTLSVEAWLLKLMVGAIDPSYDAEDEA
ncbi:hypothetical protein MNEG_5332 [Monoraphidium neglectum]|uniref:VWFA domain-containing protein n=1 Tax=Monoraphidium neglectum TaxID=145388 RepID=A0A0D2JUY0_9CHLO|nr:hypothetical protein MNEG_5332 [Monoraphidium neglectum]KIZ02628.1 hypothetical protein MNEG_5332 [Monoraphidium neglectum]|eukprot:XP_013901647.1 hypothetical protein MNEG_5332 [Monoraphidium neglectum]